ncbi:MULTISPECIES: heavy-metal-associated domain-containing protein [unclassified Sulfitobacter]|uniref:heavy-metal-associated domain-containing protein n=1 Tax=unclassified Sulfitobacter TaxID=196795 RepID=UPI003744F40F
MRQMLLAAILWISPTAIFAAEAETRLHVTGLTCPSCSYIVATALKRVETVEIAEFLEGEAEDGVYVLHYDDAVTGPARLIAAVTGVGYGATLAAEDGS